MHRSKVEYRPIVKKCRLSLAAYMLAALCIPGAAAVAQQTSQPGHASIPADQLLRPVDLS